MAVLTSKVAFQPWQGDEYKRGIQGCRVLVLGESHYHSCNDDPTCREARDEERKTLHRQLTQNVVGWWKDNRHSSPVSYRIPRLFDIDKADFWNNVAFYNYLQTFAGPEARVRPTEEQWASTANAEALQEVLDFLEPDRILVLGKKLWVNLPNQTPPLAKAPRPEESLSVSNDVRGYAEVDRVCYWYESHSGYPALAMPIMHPSAIRFVQEAWAQPIETWLRFPQ